jgi:hypothetical protein
MLTNSLSISRSKDPVRNTAGDYVAYWRYVVDRFRRADVTNVAWGVARLELVVVLEFQTVDEAIPIAVRHDPCAGVNIVASPTADRRGAGLPIPRCPPPWRWSGNLG